MIPKPEPSKVFKPAPEGSKSCVLVDQYDLGEVTTKYKGVEKTRDMIRLVFQTPDTFEQEGQTLNYNVSNRYTKTMHEMGALRPAVEALLDRRVVAEDYGVDGFDPEILIGRAVLLNIVHSDPIGDEGKIYANIKSMMPLPEGTKAPDVNDHYVRVKDREDSLPF